MIVTPTSELATAVRENLRRAVLNKESCLEFKEINPIGYNNLNSYKIRDANNIVMFALKRYDYKLNNLNGVAFHHLRGSREMYFILNRAYSKFNYNRHYAVKFIKSLQLRDPKQIIVGEGRYRLKNGILRVAAIHEGDFKLEVYNEEGKLHNQNGPAIIDFAFTNTISYYKDGKLHRSVEEGPAVLSRVKFDTSGDLEERKEYYMNGKKLSQQEVEALKGYSSDIQKDIEELDLPDF